MKTSWRCLSLPSHRRPSSHWKKTKKVATTKETAMLYLFAASFLGLCGYLYLLSQARQREASTWGHDWMAN